jgi:hypothetical protein
MDLYAYQNLCKMKQYFVRYEQKTEGYKICHFSGDYAHYSHEKV